MRPEIRLTHHASQKFEVLRRHGFAVTVRQVEETLLMPDAQWDQEGERFVAQRAISERHVLRVVYRVEGHVIVVITFYPGRRERYEGNVRT